ncbi:MAG TPA: 2'-5' RNA ligase family protein [Candidatus Saccharimonadales bacterium]|nr:2'-5' RNA ligase family protein [Candidatus Saccharimonadales bacterium]
MVPGDRLVCAVVKPIPLGSVFASWPLHVTIVPWFRSNYDSKTLAADLTQALQGFPSFLATVGKTAWFGRMNNKEVNLIERPTPFLNLEKKVRQILHEKSSWFADESTRRRRPFAPHVSVQPGDRMTLGEEFLCDRIYLVEQLGDKKKVVEVIQLNYG